MQPISILKLIYVNTKVTEKHVLIGCKHGMLGNQTFEVLQPLRWLNIVFKCYAKFTITFKLFMLWHPFFFARVKVNHRRVYSHILAKVCAVAMATGLVKNKSLDFFHYLPTTN